MNFIFICIDYVILRWIMLKFFFDFMGIFFNKNYQTANQLGQHIKNKYGEYEDICDIVKDVCLDVLNGSHFNDDMKIIAIKVLAGLKAT